MSWKHTDSSIRRPSPYPSCRRRVYHPFAWTVACDCGMGWWLYHPPTHNRSSFFAHSVPKTRDACMRMLSQWWLAHHRRNAASPCAKQCTPCTSCSTAENVHTHMLLGYDYERLCHIIYNLSVHSHARALAVYDMCVCIYDCTVYCTRIKHRACQSQWVSLLMLPACVRAFV